MNLSKRFKTLMPESKSIISDQEILALNRKDYYTGESSPVDGFFSFYEDLPKINNIQEFELLNNSLSIIKSINSKKDIYFINSSESTNTLLLYLFTNLIDQNNFKSISIKKGSLFKYPKSKNEFAEIICKKLKISEVQRLEKKNEILIILTDGLDNLNYQIMMDKFENSKNLCIVCVLNGTKIDTKDNKNPYSYSGFNYFFSISGYYICVKNN
jgi:hypothetical protein